MIDYPFWVNNFDRVKDHKQEFPNVSKIFEQPVSFWYGDRKGKNTCSIDNGLKRLMKRIDPCLPVMVIYNMYLSILCFVNKIFYFFFLIFIYLWF